MAKKSKPKQTKERIVLRVSKDFKETLIKEASDLGMDLNKYIAVIIALREVVKNGIEEGTVVVV